jgi:flagellar FliJ protein
MLLKEREKNEAFSLYKESVRRFEEVAEKLYELLKKKEDMESYQSEKLVSGLPVQEIRHHQLFLHNIEKSITHYQTVVQNARNHMQYYHEKLTEKNIELKKYQIIKEKDKIAFLSEVKQLETKEMDEISIQQYVHREG